MLLRNTFWPECKSRMNNFVAVLYSIPTSLQYILSNSSLHYLGTEDATNSVIYLNLSLLKATFLLIEFEMPNQLVFAWRLNESRNTLKFFLLWNRFLILIVILLFIHKISRCSNKYFISSNIDGVVSTLPLHKYTFFSSEPRLWR